MSIIRKVEEVIYKTGLDDNVWDVDCDTAVSSGGKVATVPTRLKQGWFVSEGCGNGDDILKKGWAFVTFIGHINAACWNIKIVVPDITKNHVVFAEVRQYIIDKLTWLDKKHGSQHPHVFSPAIDVQVYCNETQRICRLQNVAFWLKTGCLHKNGLTQLSGIMDNEVHIED